MSNKGYIGMSFNECDFMGRVVGDPQFYPQGDSEIAMLNLVTLNREMDANGQWTENEITVPLVVLEPTKVKVVKDYVKDDSQIKVETYYKSWETDGQEGHGMIVTKIKLGSKPRTQAEDTPAKKVPKLPF